MTTLVPLVRATRADVLVLGNGDRIEGQVVGETTREISLRRRFKDTNITYVQNFPRSSVARIEKGPVESQPAVTDSAPAETVASSRPAVFADDPLVRQGMIENWKAGLPNSASKDIADKPIYMRRAIERWKQGQTLAAGGELTRLLTTSKAAELDALSPECEKATGMKLAEFAAHVHWSIAKNRSKSGPLRLTGVAPYEVPAIIPLLIDEYDATMRREIQVREPADRKARRNRANPSTHPAAGANAGRVTRLPAYVVTESQPTSDPAIELANQLTILNWIDRPNELKLTRPESAAFRETIEYAISLLNERLRLYPAARRDRSLQSTLAGQRIQLRALLRAVSERAGESERAERRARVDEHEAKLKDLQKEFQQEQNNLLQKALQLAQEQQLEQNAAAKAPAPKAPKPVQPKLQTPQ